MLRQHAFGQHPTTLFHMAGIAVGDGEELHFMPHFGKQSRGAAALDITVIRMGADHHNLQGLVLGLNKERTTYQEEGKEDLSHGRSWA